MRSTATTFAGRVGIRSSRLSIAVALLVLLTACGGTNPSASTRGSAGTSPTDQALASGGAVTLELGATGGTFDAQVPNLIDAIARLSSGRLVAVRPDRWDITGTHHDGEREMIEAVAAGKLDLALVGTRSLSTMGVTDFDALIAPMLVDSYPLQQAILDSPIPAQMLPALDQLGVTGLALIGGDLRMPSGVDAPFLGPDTYAGRTFHVFSNQMGSESIAALGATPTDVVPQARDVGLADGSIAGFENSLGFAAGKPAFARHVTVNVRLWPATGVLVASPATLARLDAQQTDWLMGAVADTASRALELLTPEQTSLQSICGQGGVVYQASTDDLSALRMALQPIYDRLGADATTAGYIDQITELKRSIQATPLTVPDGCAGTGAGSDPRLPDGIYRTDVLAVDDIVAALEARGVDQDLIDRVAAEPLNNQPYVITYRLAGGAFVQLESRGTSEDVGSSGTYRVIDDSHVEFNEPCCGPTLVQFSLVGDRLTLHVDVPDADFQQFCREQLFDCMAGLSVVEAGTFIRQGGTGT